jgi:DNA-binding transcriptional ArsR family regulator
MGVVEALAHPDRAARRLLDLAKTWPDGPQHCALPASTGCRPVRQLSPDEIHALVEAHRSGLAVGQISAQFGLHRSTVGRHLAACGINTRSLLLAPEEVKEATALYRSGKKLQDLARLYDVSVTTINRILVDHGVEMRPKGRRRKEY